MYKRVVKRIGVAVLAFGLLMTSGCGKKAPDDWYMEVEQYFEAGFKDGWSHDVQSVIMKDEYKDKDLKFGYYVIDLDNDGTDEFLVGYDNGTKPTVFTDIFIYHSDFGPHEIFSGGNETIYYLCNDNTIYEEFYIGKTAYTKYMKCQAGSDNSFLVVESGGEPRIVPLTYFDY
ncbi:hypothetical protein SAMN02910369_00934 [Lachnospiraceae bacterium NE2001]|nr:hypothetical protein SAMN02910369_00934 [Lachnospiraceae bacterium NE2001]